MSVISDLIRARLQAARDAQENALRAAMKRPSREAEEELLAAQRDRDEAKEALEAINAEAERLGISMEP